MSEITSRPYHPSQCCEKCVFGRGEHAEWCEEGRELAEMVAKAEIDPLIAEEWPMPEPPHEGSCGPWAPCDGICMDRAAIAEHNRHLRPSSPEGIVESLDEIEEILKEEE